MMLLQAAADEWKVPVGELTVSNGVITHAGSNRSTSYGKVAAAAAKLPAPDLKSDQAEGPEAVEGRRQAGQARSTPRRSSNGSQIYAIDLKLPGMLNAAIKQCPVFGGKLVSYDEAKIAKMPGRRESRESRRRDRRRRRRHVVAREDRARRAADRLGRRRRREGLHRDHRRAPEGRPHVERRVRRHQRRRRAEGVAGAPKKVEAVYSVPFVAHATMEPMNARCRLTADRAEVWVPTQNAEASLAALSTASGLPLDAVRSLSADARRRFRPARRHAGLRAPGDARSPSSFRRARR